MAYKDPNFSLYRSKEGAVLGGVCSGFSESFKIDVTIIRILFLVPILVFGTGALAYIICWIVLPEKES
jgi:phage shock protein PspC (stress-responsive transcriptional regulator)